jgi:hypothetical protein
LSNFPRNLAALSLFKKKKSFVLVGLDSLLTRLLKDKKKIPPASQKAAKLGETIYKKTSSCVINNAVDKIICKFGGERALIESRNSSRIITICRALFVNKSRLSV